MRSSFLRSIALVCASLGCGTIRQTVSARDALANRERLAVLAIETDAGRRAVERGWLVLAPDGTIYGDTAHERIKLRAEDCVEVRGTFSEGDVAPNGARMVRGPTPEMVPLVVIGALVLGGGISIAAAGGVAAANVKPSGAFFDFSGLDQAAYGLLVFVGAVIAVGGVVITLAALNALHPDGSGTATCQAGSRRRATSTIRELQRR